MRYAGQRFRSSNQSQGRFTAEDGAVGDFKYRYQPAGLPQSRNSMPEVNARSMAKTEEPEFSVGDFSEPEFKA